MTTLPPPAELARLLPDEPRQVDLRGSLLSGRCAVYAGADPRDGFVVRSWDFPFAAVAGRPGAGAVRRAVEDGDPGPWNEWHLMVPAEAAEEVAELLPDWRRRLVHLHRFTSGLPEAPPMVPAGAGLPAEARIRVAPEGWSRARLDLSHLPPELHHEMHLEYVAARPMAVAEVEGRAVAFCYAPLVTEALWDVAVDTLEPYRRRGLGAACFLALAHHLGRQGRRPVWGATDSNVPSLRMAERLGFVREASLVDFVRPVEAGERGGGGGAGRELP